MSSDWDQHTTTAIATDSNRYSVLFVHRCYEAGQMKPRSETIEDDAATAVSE